MANEDVQELAANYISRLNSSTLNTALNLASCENIPKVRHTKNISRTIRVLWHRCLMVIRFVMENFYSFFTV